MSVAVSGLGFTQSAHVQMFFDKYALNHPRPIAVIPNWYYYWDQLVGVTYGTHEYENVGGTGMTHFVAGRGWISGIRSEAGMHTSGGARGHATAVDLIAWTCRHEAKHLEDMPAWWGNSDRNGNDDPDDDYIPGTTGNNPIHIGYNCGQVYHSATGGYDPHIKLTPGVRDEWQDSAGFDDGEDYCLHRQEVWSNHSADAVDWSYPGKQWLVDGKDY